MRAGRGALILMAALLPACKLGPNFKPPQEPVPDQYAGVKALPQPAPQPSTDSAAPSFWWREFRDPELDDLVDAARRGNLDLKGAYLRIVEARIQVQAVRAQGLPSLDASASYTRDQLGLAGILKSQGIDTASAPASSPAAQGLIASLEKPFNIYQLGFDASWEIDLFGKVRRSVEAANAQSVAAVESRNDLLVSLEAEVAQTYFQLRASQTLRWMKSQHNARSPILRKIGTSTVSPASPTWTPRVRSLRAWRRSCRPTSRPSRPRDTRSPCSSDKLPKRSTPDSGITEICRHCRRTSRWAYPRSWLAGGPTSEIPRPYCMPPRPRSGYPSRGCFPTYRLRARTDCGISTPIIYSIGRAIFTASPRLYRYRFFRAAR
jgi:hypothetical protein